MRQTILTLVVILALASVAAPGVAAPVDIILRQDPSGSSWSLLLDVEAGYQVGGIALFVTGLDVFVVNAENPAIGVLDSPYRIDPLGDGRNSLQVNNVANGVAIASGPSVGVLLGTLSGPNGQPIAFFDGGDDSGFGYTVLDPSLTRIIPEFSIRTEPLGPVGAIPEPRYLGWISLPIAGLMIALASRSRSWAVTRPS